MVRSRGALSLSRAVSSSRFPNLFEFTKPTPHFTVAGVIMSVLKLLSEEQQVLLQAVHQPRTTLTEQSENH